MITENWDEISTDDLIRAIINDYSEGRDLEFKREQDPDNPGHQKAVVKEVVSFANSGGGDLVTGIEEGKATALWPTKYDNIDDTALRWSNLISGNTDPEIPDHLIEIEPIEVTNEHAEYVNDNCPRQDGHVFVIRVEQSWRSPHRDTWNNQFYERGPGGKAELGTEEIRREMLQGKVLIEKAREFRDDRLSTIHSDNVTFSLANDPKVVLHVVPSDAFRPERSVDPSAASPKHSDDIPRLFHQDRQKGSITRYTADGHLNAHFDRQYNLCKEYTLTFHSGAVEAVTARSFKEVNGNKFISSDHVENCLENTLSGYVDFLYNQDGKFPMYCFLSLLGAKGIMVGTIDSARFQDSSDEFKKVDRDVARLPAVRIKTRQEEMSTVISELIDSLYYASGRKRSEG